MATSLFSQNFHWAGVGFLGDYGKKEQLYPNSSMVFDDKSCNGISCFEVFSRNIFKDQKIMGGKVVLTQAEPGSNAIGIALGVSYERLIVDRTPDTKYSDKNVLNNVVIFGNLLFMDLDTNKLVGSVPTYISYHDAKSVKMSDKELQDTVKKLLITNDLKLNFVEDALARAKNYQLPSSKILRAQVTNINLQDKAKKTLKLTNDSIDFFSMQMAQIFEGVLMSSSGIQMLPSKVGHVVGGKLKTRLASGDRTIELPSPDISIQMSLDKLGKFKKPKKDGTGDTVCYATRMNFKAQDSFEDSIFSANLKNIPCMFVRKGTVINDDSSYEKTIFSLLSKTGKAVANPKEHGDFYNKSAPKKIKETKKAFLALNKILLNN